MNITPDHLDRHGTMEQYAAIKERLIQGAGLAVVGIDDALSRAIADRRGEGLVRVHVGMGSVPADGLGAGEGIVRDGAGEELADVNGVGSLRGAHNWQNAAVAVAVARALGVAPEPIRPDWPPSPACRTGWRRSAAGAGSVRQRFEGDERRFH